MSAKIRLQRIGKKKKPYYKVVVMDERVRRDGVAIESLGRYNPIEDGVQFAVDEQKVIEWLKKGARPTATIEKLLKKAGVWRKYKEAR